MDTSKIGLRVAGANEDATSTRRCDLSQSQYPARTPDCDELGSASNNFKENIGYWSWRHHLHSRRDRLGAEGRLQPKDLCLHHHRLHVAMSPSSRGRRVSGQVPETDLPPFTQLVQEPGAIFVSAQREILLKEQVVVRSIIPLGVMTLGLLRGGLICHRHQAAAHSERKTWPEARRENLSTQQPDALVICRWALRCSELRQWILLCSAMFGSVPWWLTNQPTCYHSKES